MQQGRGSREDWALLERAAMVSDHVSRDLRRRRPEPGAHWGVLQVTTTKMQRPEAG